MPDRQLLLTPPEPGAHRLYELLHGAARGYKVFMALLAVTEAGLFDQPREPRTVGQWAELLGSRTELLAPVCELLAENGILDRDDDRYAPAPWAASLLHDEDPLCQRPVLENVAETCALWSRLPKALGQEPLDPWREGLFGGWFLPALAAESLVGEAQRSAKLVAAIPGFDQVRNMVDLGGGHALYSLALCARCPGLHAEVMDLESAREHAESWIDRLGPACADGSEVRFTPANIFADSLGHDRDAVLLFYNPGGKNPELLERIYACLRPGGLFVSKHAFYARDEGSKDALSDVEWNMTAFPGVRKGPHVYSFAGDLCQEDYFDLLRQRFEVLAEYGPEDFASPDLGKFGDRLDSRLVVCRKPLEQQA